MNTLNGGSTRLPKEMEDGRFLLEIPDDFDMENACLRLQKMAREPSVRLNTGLVAAIKIVLNLEFIDSYSDMRASKVILNAVREAEQLCGFTSPEIILKLLIVQRKEIKDLLGSAPSAE